MRLILTTVMLAAFLSTSAFAQIREKQLSSTFTNELIRRDGSVAFTGAVDMGGFKVTNAADGTAASDLATKGQLDAISSGLDPKESVRTHEEGLLDDDADISGSPSYSSTGGASSRGQITATLAVSGVYTVDDIAMASTDRILISGEGSGTAEVMGVDTVADSTDSLDGTFWVFYTNASTAFYVWYDTPAGAGDPAPTPPAGVSFTGIQVSIATDALASAVASATETAIEASSAQVGDVIVGGGGSNELTITNTFGGNVTDVADGSAPTGFTIATDTQGTGLGADANGIYVVTISGTSLTLNRSTDFDNDSEVSQGAYVLVSEGTVHEAHGHILLTSDPITIGGAGGTSQTWGEFSKLALGLVGEVTTVNAGDAAAAGTSGRAAHADHEHAVATATAGAIQPDDSASEGVSTSLSRADHTHSIVAAVAGAIQPDDSAAEGVATSFSRSDHVHSIVAATAGTISPDDASQEGVATSFSRSDHQHAISADVAVDVGTSNSEGSSSSFARADHVHDAPAPTTSDKQETPSVTSGDDQDTGVTVAVTPALDSFVQVEVNGVLYSVGNGVDTLCTYFADAGALTTPVSISAIKATDHLIWNDSVCGFPLDATDRVSLHYPTF
jgi:hypothetical protein